MALLVLAKPPAPSAVPGTGEGHILKSCWEMRRCDLNENRTTLTQGSLHPLAKWFCPAHPSPSVSRHHCGKPAVSQPATEGEARRAPSGLFPGPASLLTLGGGCFLEGASSLGACCCLCLCPQLSLCLPLSSWFFFFSSLMG